MNKQEMKIEVFNKFKQLKNNFIFSNFYKFNNN